MMCLTSVPFVSRVYVGQKCEQLKTEFGVKTLDSKKLLRLMSSVGRTVDCFPLRSLACFVTLV